MVTFSPVKRKVKVSAKTAFLRKIGFASDDSWTIIRQVRAGIPYARLASFQKVSGLSLAEISSFTAIPLRTLARRQKEGRLHPDESDHLWRAVKVFAAAVDLFDGDVGVACDWLRRPRAVLGGESSLTLASTEDGAHEVKNLIGCIEHGIFI